MAIIRFDGPGSYPELIQGALMSIPELKQQDGIPADYSFHYPMMIGYAKTRYYRLPQRKAPRIAWE